MLFTALAVGVALLVPLVTRGSYVRLLDSPWRWGWFLTAGLALQVGLDVLPIPESRWHDVGFGLLVASYVLILGFCGANAVLRGMAVVFVGIACNAAAITMNQGMPIDAPPEWLRDGTIEETVKHHPQDGDDRLVFLTDIIVLRAPFDTVLSFGDLIMAVGLVDVTFHASRRSRRRSARQEIHDTIDLAALETLPESAPPQPVGRPARSHPRDRVPRAHDPGERVEYPPVVHVPGR